MAQIYSLVIEIDDASLRTMAGTGLRLVVAKPAGASPPNVAWLAWEPRSSNTLVWDDCYGLYAAPVPARTGSAIHVEHAVHPAFDRRVYSYCEGFAPPLPVMGGPRRRYDVRNDAPERTLFGLLQSATVNERPMRAPVNAVALPATFSANFAAVETVYVWVRRGIAAGSIAPDVPPGAAVIDFGETRPVRRYRYTASTNRFQPMSTSGNGTGS